MRLTLQQQMGSAFPELNRANALITETLKLEESRFKDTLDRGLKLLEEETGKLGGGQALPGEVAFKLYDTFGFPVDIVQDVVRDEALTLDISGFDDAMARQAVLDASAGPVAEGRLEAVAALPAVEPVLGLRVGEDPVRRDVGEQRQALRLLDARLGVAPQALRLGDRQHARDLRPLHSVPQG